MIPVICPGVRAMVQVLRAWNSPKSPPGFAPSRSSAARVRAAATSAICVIRSAPELASATTPQSNAVESEMASESGDHNVLHLLHDGSCATSRTEVSIHDADQKSLQSHARIPSCQRHPLSLATHSPPYAQAPTKAIRPAPATTAAQASTLLRPRSAT